MGWRPQDRDPGMSAAIRVRNACPCGVRQSCRSRSLHAPGQSREQALLRALVRNAGQSPKQTCPASKGREPFPSPNPQYTVSTRPSDPWPLLTV